MRNDGDTGTEWAQRPRPPRTLVLTEDLVRQVVATISRVGQGAPALARTVVVALLTSGVGLFRSAGVTAGVGLAALLLLVGLPLLLVQVRSRAAVSAGETRTTGYDTQGRWVFSGRSRFALAAGWARSVDRRGDLMVLRPRTRGGRPIVVPAGLVSDEDLAFLTGPADSLRSLPLSLNVTRSVRTDVRRAVLGNLWSLRYLLLMVALFVVELLIFGDLPGTAPLVYAGAATAIARVGSTAALMLLVHVLMRGGSVLRSGVEDGVLRIEGSALLPRRVALEAGREATPAAVLRVRRGARRGRRSIVPTALVPPEHRPPRAE